MFKRLGILTILIVLALMVSVPAVSARGQALVTGSIWIEDDIHINFNARWISDEENPIAATGHVFWREDGQINRLSVNTMVIWEDGCAYIGGQVYDGPRNEQNLCLIVCESNWSAAWWNRVEYFKGVVIDHHRGNLIIKP